LLIVHLEAPNPGNEGDHVYRTAQPCRGLGTVADVTVVSGTLLSTVIHDLVRIADVLCKAADLDMLPIVKSRRAENLLTVFEINDDFTAIQPWNPTATFFHTPINRSLVYQLIEMSHCSQASAPELERRFGHLPPPCRVFPNHLWQMPERLPKPRRLTIGWGGSIGHLEDVAWIVPALRELLGKHREVRLAIMGYGKIRELFDWVRPEQLSLTTPGSLEEYTRFFQSLHIGIAPLQPTDFNRCRSDVKFLEYAAAGAVSVCSDLEPYSDKVQDRVTGMLFKDPDDLVACLETLIGDEPFRARLQQAAYRYVETERLELSHARDRLRFYEEQRHTRSREGGSPDRRAEIARLIGSHAPIERSTDAEYYTLAYGDLETLLHTGLLHQGKDPQEATRHFEEAMALAPDFHLPYLYAGSVDPDVARGTLNLRRALERNPNSCAAAFHLGLRLRAAGDTEGAGRAFAQAIRIAPELAPAHECLGEMAEQGAQPDRAAAHWRDALRANRFYRQPAIRLHCAPWSRPCIREQTTWRCCAGFTRS
jgi:glycosyltransferase involved in cell wall biosynthesis